MITPVERSNHPESAPVGDLRQEAGNCSLLLIPVLLCLSMLIFALAT